MRTQETVAAMIERATTRAGLVELGRTIGFDDPVPLEPALASSLGVAALVREAQIARGTGTLRALIVQTNRSASTRESAAAIASRLARSAPQLLWLLLLRRRGSREVVLATWSPDRARPRIAALVIDTAHVLDSDVDTLRALEAARDSLDVLTHARWLETLGRESLTRRFYRTLERLVGEMAAGAPGRASAEDRSELAILCVSRLLFLSFLQTRGWLDGDPSFLERSFTECMGSGGGYHRRVLLPLFFGTLNTPPRQRAPAARRLGRIPFLNGGLFARTATERRCRHLSFDDDALGTIFGELLLRYRFSAREDSDRWSESAIDPEMLGRVFESLMASRDRRASGAFYTPQPLVASITRSALLEALAPRPAAIADIERLLDGEDPPPGTARALLQRLRGITLLDPACGSGAFLVHALEAMASLAARLGDDRPTDAIRRSILGDSIFGVDINPTAVWLCELRLWLSVVIESAETDPLAAPPLPNLDHHIRVGDALAGEGVETMGAVQEGATIARLRQRYARATGCRKIALARELDRRERSIALGQLDDAIGRCTHRRRDLLTMLRSRDLFGERRRADRAERATIEQERQLARELRARRRALSAGGALPFSFASHFPDIAARGGFDLVIGNPPWVRLHRIPTRLRVELRRRFDVLARPCWEEGAAAANAGKGFAAQTDLAALFLERSLALLRPDGALALLVPAKLWRSLAGGGVRRHLLERARITRVEDWSEAPAAFDAAVYPSLLVARRRVSSANPGSPVRAHDEDPSPHRSRVVVAVLHRSQGGIAWQIAPSALGLDDSAASPWILVPAAVRDAFERLRLAGPPLAESALGRPQLGVKCGCNGAFIVTLLATHGAVATVRANGAIFQVERELLRPLVRGERVTPWRLEPHAERILWTHGSDGRPLAAMPPRALIWLRRWRTRLAARADGRSGAWWSLFRTPAAAFATPRVLWSDFGRAPRAAPLVAGDPAVPLNSCYVLRCETMDDAWAFAALLNSPVAAAWLRVLAEPARGGYCRFLAWTVALLPAPADWTRARALLAPLGARAAEGSPPDAATLTAAVSHAYGVRRHAIDPLLLWGSV